MNLQKTYGTIENLHTTQLKEPILFSPNMQEAAAFSAQLFATVGMGAAAAQTSANVDSSEVGTIYSFELAGVRYSGCTRNATFANGDEVEVVFETSSRGNEVFGVKRPSTHSIWMYPYMSRGTSAAVWSSLKLWFLASLGFSILGSIGLLIVGLLVRDQPMNWHALMYLSAAATAAAFIVLAVAGLVLVPKLLRFAHGADEVFSAFGYVRPRDVDLYKTTKMHLRTNNIPLTAENCLDLWY